MLRGFHGGCLAEHGDIGEDMLLTFQAGRSPLIAPRLRGNCSLLLVLGELMAVHTSHFSNVTQYRESPWVTQVILSSFRHWLTLCLRLETYQWVSLTADEGSLRKYQYTDQVLEESLLNDVIQTQASGNLEADAKICKLLNNYHQDVCQTHCRSSVAAK
jgi:hypothetical protein